MKRDPTPPAPDAKPELPIIPGLPSETLLDCIHCGICLSVCPTFDLLGTEGDSPRGRIYLMRALSEGRAELNPGMVRHLDTCLACRACETACPSGVHYAELLAPVRDYIEKHYPRPAREKRIRRLVLDLVTRPRKLAPLLLGAKAAGRLFGDRGGPVALVNRYLFGPHAPAVPVPEEAGLTVRPLPALTPARGERRARVALLAGCVMQVLFQRVNRATIRVLSENGCEVVVPANAGCCGALHMHGGALEEARALARGAIEGFEKGAVDAVVINSAGCGSTMKEYGELFAGTEWEERARSLAGKTRDVSEFLVELGFRPPEREFRKRVTYHDACHLAHGQKIRSQPRELLKAIPGLELVELPDSDWCCGSAGIYNFLEPELAGRLQEKKVNNVLSVSPEIVVTGNPGCHAWIEAGLRARGASAVVRHTMELLDEAYGPR